MPVPPRARSLGTSARSAPRGRSSESRGSPTGNGDGEHQQGRRFSRAGRIPSKSPLGRGGRPFQGDFPLDSASHRAGVEFDPNVTKAEASKRIDELQAKTGRGQQQRE
ncbi:DUF3072 domain-containing protein [Sorangium sp. So ce302]